MRVMVAPISVMKSFMTLSSCNDKEFPKGRLSTYSFLTLLPRTRESIQALRYNRFEESIGFLLLQGKIQCCSPSCFVAQKCMIKSTLECPFQFFSGVVFRNYPVEDRR